MNTRTLIASVAEWKLFAGGFMAWVADESTKRPELEKYRDPDTMAMMKQKIDGDGDGMITTIELSNAFVVRRGPFRPAVYAAALRPGLTKGTRRMPWP